MIQYSWATTVFLIISANEISWLNYLWVVNLQQTIYKLKHNEKESVTEKF